MSAVIVSCAAPLRANMTSPGREPDIQIVDVDLEGDRRLMVHHQVRDGIVLDEEDADMVLQHLADLWGYEVLLREVDADDGRILDEHVAEPHDPFM